jgi:hypothetical protein
MNDLAELPPFDITPAECIQFKGMFRAEVWSKPRKSGLRSLISSWRKNPGLLIKNSVVDTGINDNENVYFAGSTQRNPWYFGLVDNSGFTAFSASDTMSSHSGWSEFTNYSESVRQTWSVGTASAKTITGTASSAFTMAGSAAIKGAFLTSNNTKGGTTGQLWSEGAFGVVQSLVTSQVLRVNYTLTGASS